VGNETSGTSGSDGGRRAAEPAVTQVWNHLVYGLSLPERAMRATGAMVGGALRESANLLVPNAFRTSRSYSIFVQQSLDFLSEKVGGVERPGGAAPSPTEVVDFVARKAVGNFVELAGLATFHLSPMTILAVVSDVAYGSQTFLKELSTELKRQGIVPEHSTIDNAGDLLEALRDASGTAAQAFDLPPLSIEGLQSTIDQTRKAVGRIDPTALIPQAELQRLWNEMRDVADKQKVGLFELSSAMSMFTLRRVGEFGGGALSTVRVAGNLFDRHILEHYSESLRTIRDKGYYETLSEVSKPYYDAVWRNFASDRATVTAEVLSGRAFGQAWRGVTGWIGVGRTAPTNDKGSGTPSGAASEATVEIDWRVSIAPGLEGLQVAVFAVRGAKIAASTPEQVAEWERLVKPVLDGDAEGGEGRRQAIRGLLRRGGFKPSGRSKPAQEYLLGVLKRDGRLPQILNAVDALNAVSVASGLPISMLSLDRCGTEWHLRYGREGETFVFNSAGQEIDVAGAIVIEGDAENLVDRISVGSPVKDSAWGKITEADREFGVCLYASDEAIDEGTLKGWAERLADAIARSTGGKRSPVRIIGV